MNEPTSFLLPGDNWYHIATPGEWPHKPTGFVQVLDDEAMAALVQDFQTRATEPNWPGLLIDFDHQSLDQDKPTVAAGWITDLDRRDSGIWARIRWSDLGRDSIQGGRYRFISPVWRSTDCAKLDDNRIRPLKLMNCAVTNDPNIKGLFPLSNSANPVADYVAPALPLIANRAPLTEEQRRAIWAKSGSGGGGGGDRKARTEDMQRQTAAGQAAQDARRNAPPAPSDNPNAGTAGYGRNLTPLELLAELSARSPAETPAPKSPTTTRVASTHQARIQELQDAKSQLEALRPPKPQPPRDYSQMDVREAMNQAMKLPGATSADVIAARDAARAHNESAKNALRAIKKDIRKQYSTPEQQERALKRHMDKEQREFSKAMDEWDADNKTIDKALNRIDSDIAVSNLAIAREEQRQEKDMARSDKEQAEAEARERQQAIRNQIDADKAAASKAYQDRLAAGREARAAKEAADAPMTSYNAELRRRSAYIDAMTRGDVKYAESIYPEADHAKVLSTVKAILSADPNSSNKKARDQALQELRSLPPPLVNVV